MSLSRNSRFPADHAGALLAALLMMLLGWGGLALLISSTTPRIGPRWIFFILLQIAVTGSALPLARLLHARFTPRNRPQAPAVVLVRQSIWLGLFIVLCAWLQIPRALQPHSALLLALVFLILEIFLRAREVNGERRRNPTR